MELSMLTFSLMGDHMNSQMDADTLCKIASDNGVRMIDPMLFEIPAYGEAELKDALAKYDMKCGCIIAPLPLFADRETLPEKLEEALDCAESFGTGKLMVIPGYGDEKVCAQMAREELLGLAVEGYRMAVEAGLARGIQVCFENTPQDWKPLSAASDCRYVLDNVPELGFVFDTANFRVADTSCDELAAYELLKDRLVRVHIKDVVIGIFSDGEKCMDGQYMRAVALGAGVIPADKIIEKLKSDGYDGVCCIEYAAGNDVHGLDHSKYLKVYVDNLKAFESGNRMLPPYKEIPGTGKKASKIFFGTALLPMLKGECVNSLLDAVLASGINAFDCARGYGNAEVSLGGWLKERNNRERIVLLTKCGNIDMEGHVCVNRNVIEKELETSLETLGTDYIDIYLLHRDDPATPVSEFIETLNEAKKSGKIRCFGASNWTYERIAEANAYAEEHGLDGFMVSSPNYGLARQIQDPWGGGCVTVSGPENADARAWYAANGMPVLAYSSLGRGFFSGKFKAFDYETAEQVLDFASVRGYLCEENMQRLKNAEILAEKYNETVPQIAMRYIFGSDMNVFAIVSSGNPGRLAGNIMASRMPLSKEEVEFLESDTK